MKGIFVAFCLALALIETASASIDCTLLSPGFRAKAVSNPPALGTKRVLWYRLAFAADARQPISSAEAEPMLRQAQAALERMSYNQLSITWQFTPLLQLPGSPDLYRSDYILLIRHAREAAAAAGFNYQEFDRDLLAPPAVPGWTQGLAIINDRALYVGVPSAGLILHEFGHTLGLPHANAWETSRPNPFQLVSPPFPTGALSQHPFETNSFVGRASISAPGTSIEYGDLFDNMGPSQPDAEFNAIFKRRLGWLTDSHVARVSGNSTVRLYSHITANFQPGRSYAARIEKRIVGRHSDRLAREYWIENRNGQIQLRWGDGNHDRASLLLDATPGTIRGFEDSSLPMGKTFSDAGFDLFITPIAQGDEWIDVAIVTAPPPNRPPVLRVTGQFSAEAIDPDGDPVYISWNFADRLHAFGPAATMAWDEDGDYVVRCEAGDARGGTSSTNMLVRIGNPSQLPIKGRVIDAAGDPVPDARVHNGRVNIVPGDRSDFFSTHTDSAGHFIIPADDAAPVVPGSYRYGYRSITPERAVAPGGEITLVLEILPRVSVSAPAIVRPGEPVPFTITRSGSVSESLEVWWQGASPGVATIPSGQRSTIVYLTDSEMLNIVIPSQFLHEGVTHYYPGYELRGDKWFQTDPPYVTFEDAFAAVQIVDDTEHRLAFGETFSGEKRLEVFGPMGRIFQVDVSFDLVSWLPYVTNKIEFHPTAVSIPQAFADPARFYRSRLLQTP